MGKIRRRLQRWYSDFRDEIEDDGLPAVLRYRLRRLKPRACICRHRESGRYYGWMFRQHWIGQFWITWLDLRYMQRVFEVCLLSRDGRDQKWRIGSKFVPSPPEVIEMHKVLEVRLSDGQQTYPAGSMISWDVESASPFPVHFPVADNYITEDILETLRKYTCEYRSGYRVSPGHTHTKALGNPQKERKMESKLLTKDYLEKLGYAQVTLIAAPVGAFDRLNKALEKAKHEGRGTTSLDDLGIQFFNAVDPAGPNTYAGIERTSTGNVIVSDYKLWEPQGVDEIGKELYDCYAVANEINALK